VTPAETDWFRRNTNKVANGLTVPPRDQSRRIEKQFERQFGLVLALMSEGERETIIW